MTELRKKYILLGSCLAVLSILVVLAVALITKPSPEPEETVATTEATTQATTLPPPTENVFTPMDFVYDGEYLTCVTAPCIRGIDVSTHQKQIDWQQVKEAGFEFVMIRLG